MNKLIEKYSKHYGSEFENFDFTYAELTFEIMRDFNGWKQTAMIDGDEHIIIFYQES